MINELVGVHFTLLRLAAFEANVPMEPCALSMPQDFGDVDRIGQDGRSLYGECWPTIRACCRHPELAEIELRCIDALQVDHLLDHRCDP